MTVSFVSVLSINGTAGGQVATDQRAAMDAVRQADRLLVESVSNATDQDSFTGQIAENLVGTDRANKDWFLFAIGVDQNGAPRTANAGPLAEGLMPLPPARWRSVAGHVRRRSRRRLIAIFELGEGPLLYHRTDAAVAAHLRCRTTAPMRMALAPLDRSGDGTAATRLQHAIDFRGPDDAAGPT